MIPCTPYVAAGLDYWSTGGVVADEIAKGVCAGCPGRKACLLGALEQGDDWTVRGGLTAAERRRLPRARVRVRVRGQAAHGTNGGYQRCTDGEDGFLRCRKCRRAHARAVAGHRARSAYADTFRGAIAAVEEPSGQFAIALEVAS